MIKIFLIRLIVSILLALIIGRFFFEGKAIIKALGLAAVMLFLSYLFESTRKKDKIE